MARRVRGVCFRCFVGIGSISGNVDLLVAALDLQLVRLVRGAMNNQNARVPGAPGAPLGPSARVLQPRRRVEPEPHIEPRKRIEPTPRFEPRPVIRLKPRVELDPCGQPCHPPCIKKTPVLEPPWAVVPWKMPLQPAPKIKLNIYRPDVISKGSLIDFFI